MSNAKQPTSSRPLLLQGLGILFAGALGVTVALLLSGTSRSAGPQLSSASSPAAAYRPSLRAERARAAAARASASGSGPSAPSSRSSSSSASSDHADGEDDALSPELEARLQAAASVVTVPAQLGAPLPPPAGSLPPEAEVARHRAMIEWEAQVQQLLDRCVARPKDLRQPAEIRVILAAPVTAAGLAPQQLAPVAVTLPVDDLRRLWNDTDPDALQGCLDQVRTLAIAVPPPPNGSARVMPSSFENLRVQL